MASVRHQIASRVVTILEGLSSSPHIEESVGLAIRRAQLPAAVVERVEETSEIANQDGDHNRTWILRAVVMASTWAAVDALSVETEIALESESWSSIAVTVQDIQHRRTNFAENSDGDSPILMAALEYEFFYCIAPSNPEGS